MAESRLNLILYVATEEGVYRRLSRLLKRLQYVHNSCRVVIARFSDVMSATRCIPVFTVDGDRFIRDDLLPEGEENSDVDSH